MRRGCPLLLAAALASCAGPAEAPAFHSPEDLGRLEPGEQRVWDSAERASFVLERVGRVVDDPELEAYAAAILDELFPELEGAFHVRILAQPAVNAYTLANGSMYLFAGTLARMENEAQFATVLAHEGIHFTHRHTWRKRTHGQNWLAGSGAVYGRSHEQEADRLGLERLVRAGYEPEEAVLALEHLLEVERLNAEDFADHRATHPPTEERIERMRELVRSQTVRGGRTNAATYLEKTRTARVVATEQALARTDSEFVLLALANALGTGARPEVYPDHVDYYLGEAFRLRGEVGDRVLAQAAYLRALQRAPDYPGTHRALGRLYLERGDAERAEEHLRRYLVLDPRSLERAHVEAELAGLEVTR